MAFLQGSYLTDQCQLVALEDFSHVQVIDEIHKTNGEGVKIWRAKGVSEI